MATITHYTCARCGRAYAYDPLLFTCAVCGPDPSDPGVLEPHYAADEFRAALRRAMAAPPAPAAQRFGDLLPMAPVDLGQGNTPLLPLRESAYDGEVWLKNETANPTGSFKDRLASVIAAAAREQGATTMALVSSGNMGAAVAAFGAVAGVETVVIVSSAVDPGKLAQIRLYGAQVLRVDGNSSQRLGLVNQGVAELGWYNAASPFNPLGPEGAKTAAYELVAQLGDAPDWLIIPTGFGCNLDGQWRAFRELHAAGLCGHLPRLVAVCPAGSPTLHEAFHAGREMCLPGPQGTLAHGLSATVTPGGRQALRALRQSGGTCVAVTDGEMLEAEAHLARRCGLFVEPSAAAGLAGFRQMVLSGALPPGGRVVIVLTGSGFKDMDAAQRLLPAADSILAPDFAAVRRLLGN